MIRAAIRGSAPNITSRSTRAVAVYQQASRSARRARPARSPLVHSHGVGDQRPGQAQTDLRGSARAGAFIAPKSGDDPQFAGSGGVHFQRKPIRLRPSILAPNVRL